MERAELLERLLTLPSEPFEKLCFTLSLPKQHLEGNTLSKRAMALIEWCESGQLSDGLKHLEVELNKVQPPPQHVTGHSLPSLEIHFYPDPTQAGGWLFSVHKRGFRVRQERWNPPVEENTGSRLALFKVKRPQPKVDQHGVALFEHLLGSDPDYREKPWQLRISVKDSRGNPQGTFTADTRRDPANEIPLPSAPWWRLARPPYGESLYDLGWSLCEQTGALLSGRTNGRVLIIGDEALKNALRPWLGPDVFQMSLDDLTHDEPPREAIWVVGPALEALNPEDQAELQLFAFDARCPMLVWCAQAPASRARMGEVVCVGKPLEGRSLAHWLASFLTWLKDPGGLPPEQAFAAVNRGDPLGRTAWWLRGAFQSWEVTTPAFERPEEFLHDWYRRIDRRLQEGGLTDLLEPLLKSHHSQRVLLVLVPGEPGAGLAMFRERPLKIVESVPHFVYRPTWSENPDRQLERLFRLEGAEDEHGFIAALKRKAGERLTLFLVHHQTILLQSGKLNTDQATGAEIPVEAEPWLEEDLRHYIHQLEALARQLQNANRVRLCVHISVVKIDKRKLEASILDVPPNDPSIPKRVQAQPAGAPLRWSVLPEMKARLPLEELQMWAEHRGVELSEEELKRLAALPFEEILEILEQRLLGVRRR